MRRCAGKFRRLPQAPRQGLTARRRLGRTLRGLFAGPITNGDDFRPAGRGGGRRHWLGIVALAMAVQVGTGFDHQAVVPNIAVDLRCLGQVDAARPDPACHLAPDDHFVGYDLSGDGGLFTDHQFAAGDIALDRAVQLHFARGLQDAGDFQIGGNQ